MAHPRTMFEKIWNRHVIYKRSDGQTLLYIDRHLVHDGSFHAFNMLRAKGYPVSRPKQTFAIPDHYVPSGGRAPEDYPDEDRRQLVINLSCNAKDFKITEFGIGDVRQGIVHIVGPEQGITQPGMIMVCGDSHTSTHGALGAFAFGIGATEAFHVLATQSLWQRKPVTMRITVKGLRPFGVSAKDVILAIISKIGAGGAVGAVIEYAGKVIRDLTIEERFTVCNMSIEAGARAGMIAPDEKTIAYLKGRPYAPKDEKWKNAVAIWKTMPSDPNAMFDREFELNSNEIMPMVTWGTSPEDALPITSQVPDPSREEDVQRRAKIEKAVDYMGLTPGLKLTEILIDQVFIGSCTNGRIEDLRAAASVARNRRAVVPTMVVPGSGLIKAQAEIEGLDRIFRDAGFKWLEPGCSMCVGINGDMVAAGKRCASTSNRNFAGRQGPGSRTHLMSPAMATAAAVTGHLTDVRQLEIK